MNIQTPQSDVRLIPLSELVLSEFNARQIVDDAEIEAMADSIAVAGLLQNLIGFEQEDGRIGIVGGGKRMRALQLLASEDWGRARQRQPIDPVPVKVTDDHVRAIAWAGTENTARSNLHPADEITAYAAMRARGSSNQMIARSFAQSEAHVERRLKLADLPEDVIAALRANEITIEVARALTLATDNDRCLATLNEVRGRDVRAETIRRELVGNGVKSTDRRARYVGLMRYAEEGGKSDRDLFEGHSYLHDEKLLQKLFIERLKEEAEIVRAMEGWKWAEIMLETYVDYNQISRLEKIWRTQHELPEADLEEHSRLEELAESGLLDAEGQAAYEALEARMEGDFTDEDRETAGIFVGVSCDGKLNIERAYRRPADRPGEQDTPDETAGRSDGKAPGSDAEPKGFPQNLRDDLSRIRLAAIQTNLLEQPELMLDLLAYSLSGETSPWDKPLGINVDRPNLDPEKAEGTMIDARLADQAGAGARQSSPEGFSAFRGKGKKHRNTVLTHTLARAFRSVGTVSTKASQLSDMVAAQIGVDVRKIWTPTAAGFLGRVNVAYLDDLWAKLLELDVDDERIETFGKLKKAEKAKALEALFSDMAVREAHGLSRAQNASIDAWLPAELKIGEA